MKHLSKIVLFMALIGLLPAGCVNDMITEEIISHPDYIGFSSTTTRASIADISSLKSDGFSVYATAGSKPGWYKDEDNNLIDGANMYKYSSNQWTFEHPVKWSSVASDYPMNFYAHYPFSPTGLTVTGDFTSGAKIEGVYTVQGVGSQVDLLAAKATAKSRPSSGHLTLSFNHILSKVNFGIIAGKGTQPAIQSLQLVNIGDKRTYDFVADDWMSALSGNASYYYFDATGGSASMPFMPLITDETTANPFYSVGHDKHLMLMPQTAPSWSPQSDVAPDATSGAYISVIYRMSTGLGTFGNGDLREVGLLDATDHPDYNAFGLGITGPLYVKAGFPLPATAGHFTLEKGKSHLYNIVLGAHGSSNGYILDDYYYDERGNRTGLQLIEVLKEGKKIGDKLQDGVIHVVLDVDYWDNQDGGDISPGTITVSKKNILLRYDANSSEPQSITVNSLKANGKPDLTTSWTIEVPIDQDWVKISFDKNASFATAKLKLENTGSQTVYFFTTEHTNVIRDEVVFFLNEKIVGNIYLAHNYNSLSFVENRPDGFNTYVGAFWRADETGERIINIPAGAVNTNLGHWTAYVAWKDPRWGNDNDIKISTDRLPGDTGADPNLYKSNPGNAEDYQVVNDEAVAKGILANASDNIIFRIGLQSTYTPTTNYPARYAVIILSYAGNKKHQKIYLRQGEDADYLFSNSDQVNSGGLTTRTVTGRFSPYNLTADIFDKAADVQGANPPVNPGKFTKFPTQAGAFFQWANTYNGTTTDWIRMRWAWNPYVEDIPTSPDALRWYPSTPAANIAYWSTLEAAHETCPPGYRRPHDGSITAGMTGTNISNSELRQSLFQNPQTDFNYSANLSNSMLGYYADGFFDRHKINNAGNAVAEGTGGVAYIGRLFYNSLSGSDHYGASLFLPYGGRREGDKGKLSTALAGGAFYWTASITGNINNAIALKMMETHESPSVEVKNSGFMIRCIKKPAN